MRFSTTYRTLFLLMLCLFVGLAVSSARAQSVLYVQPGATGDCSSWAAACGLQDALAAAAAGDEIWVAEGTYTPTDGTDRTVSFELVNGVALYGGFTGTETARDERDYASNVTILSGDIGTPGDSLDNSYHVVHAQSVDSTTVLDGFTVTGGNANGTDYPTYSGGGLYCDGSDAGTVCNPTIRNVIFTDNYAGQSGGAMYNESSEDGESSPVLINVLFAGNRAGEGGAMANSAGIGGESSPVLTNVTFAGNSAGQSGGAMASFAFVGDSSPVLTNVIFWGNTAPDGSQIFNSFATPVLRYTLIQGGCPEGSDCGLLGFTILTADPLFADPASGDYRLQGPAAGRDASPAIDAGTPDTTGMGLPAVDLEGNPRVTDVVEAGIDLGAFESTGAPLPVELASFTAQVEGRAVVLTWRTLSEYNSAAFEIQHTTGAVETRDPASLQWKTIATVDAAGTSTEAQSYTYCVEDLDYGTYTFRLRQEDLDGTTETLGEVEAVVALVEPYVISKVYPNPSLGRATVEVAVREAQHVRVEVYDVLGRRVATPFEEEVPANDTRRVRLDGSRLSSGVYFVRVVGEDFSETRRLVVAR